MNKYLDTRRLTNHQKHYSFCRNLSVVGLHRRGCVPVCNLALAGACLLQALRLPLLLLPHVSFEGKVINLWCIFIRLSAYSNQFVRSRSGNLTGALEVQLLDVADGSTTTAWRLEGKQVAEELPIHHDRTIPPCRDAAGVMDSCLCLRTFQTMRFT